MRHHVRAACVHGRLRVCACVWRYALCMLCGLVVCTPRRRLVHMPVVACLRVRGFVPVRCLSIDTGSAAWDVPVSCS